MVSVERKGRRKMRLTAQRAGDQRDDYDHPVRRVTDTCVYLLASPSAKQTPYTEVLAVIGKKPVVVLTKA